jgi:hypothetical protein
MYKFLPHSSKTKYVKFNLIHLKEETKKPLELLLLMVSVVSLYDISLLM